MQDVPYAELRARLLKDGQVLEDQRASEVEVPRRSSIGVRGGNSEPPAASRCSGLLRNDRNRVFARPGIRTRV